MPQRIVCPTKLLHPKAVVPTRGTEFAAGHDIACIAGLEGLQTPNKFDQSQLNAWSSFESLGYVNIHPQQSFLFRTGFAQAIDPDYVCLLWDRSGLGAGKKLGKLAGVIDSDYRGEWFVRIVNHSSEMVQIRPGEKIVQGVYQLRVEAECPVVDDLPESGRGTAAFGSTDKPH